MQQASGKLIMCPTPLGNLGDMPPRAVDALRAADVVCCEDTRVTGKLLAALGIEGKRLERMDEEVLAQRGPAIIERVQTGEVVAFCSDAGMPGVSDPGARLVALAQDAGVPVEVIPGPTAVATAYVASGFSCPQFYFGGFFPRKAGERTAALETIASLPAVSIFYESPRRMVACLQVIADVLPLRQVAVCRELTKLHEEVLVDTPANLVKTFSEREAGGGIKGEIVVVIDAPGADEAAASEQAAMDHAATEAQKMLEGGRLSKKDIVLRLQAEFGISRNAAYQLVHGGQA